MRVEHKASITIILTMALLCLVLLIQGVRQHNQTLDEVMHRSGDRIDQQVMAARDYSFAHYEERINSLITVHTQVVEAFAARDRELLLRRTRPLFQRLQQENRYFTNIHFHLPDGTSFLRVHDPDLHGDNIAEKRPMVAEAHRLRSQLSGCEQGIHGNYFRVINPVFAQGRYLGAIEFAISM